MNFCFKTHSLPNPYSCHLQTKAFLSVPCKGSWTLVGFFLFCGLWFSHQDYLFADSPVIYGLDLKQQQQQKEYFEGNYTFLSLPWLKLAYEVLITHYLSVQNNAAQNDTKRRFKETFWLS